MPGIPALKEGLLATPPAACLARSDHRIDRFSRALCGPLPGTTTVGTGTDLARAEDHEVVVAALRAVGRSEGDRGVAANVARAELDHLEGRLWIAKSAGMDVDR